MTDVWTRWQGHVINGVFPLGRYLGCSDHSGVFLTRAAARSHSDVAIKLVPANRALAEYQLPRWKRAGGLAHPHLLRLFEWGGCQLEGSPYLYVVMEYADQTLAQLLPRRALTDEEAREMLMPVLDALGFLHGRDLVQGQLKPANVLVVGDQLKLASDTVRRTGERRPSGHAPSAYDPPEALPGTGSPAGDVWGLGVTLCEALSRRPPPTGSGRDALALPPDFSPQFRDLVVRCLSLRPQDRPGVGELVAWVRGQSTGSVTVATLEPAAAAQPDSRAAEPEPAPVAPLRTAAEGAQPARDSADGARPPPPAADVERPMPVSEHAARPARAAVVASISRTQIAATLGVLLVVAFVWAALHLSGRHPTSAARPPIAQSPGPAAGEIRRPVSSGSVATAGSGVAASPQPLHEVIPRVPLNALRTIRGHIKVWVRVIVDQDGSVLAADVDRAGPSRYFQRLALRAAKEWTFPTAATASRRLMQIQFEFSRDGARGRAVSLN